jgi:hypothetical protein
VVDDAHQDMDMDSVNAERHMVGSRPGSGEDRVAEGVEVQRQPMRGCSHLI